MTIILTGLANEDYCELQRLIEEFYLELGEDDAQSSRYATQFAKEIEEAVREIVLIKQFVSGQLVGFGFLTKLNAASEKEYGVFDQVFLIKQYRNTFHEQEIQLEAKRIGENKGLNRIDIATPTDAWHRTVRYFKDRSFRLTAPKFKRVFRLSKAA